jgi:hypothetical protein
MPDAASAMYPNGPNMKLGNDREDPDHIQSWDEAFPDDPHGSKKWSDSWVRSVARRGRTDKEMRALYPDLDPFGPPKEFTDPKIERNQYPGWKPSDIISYHRKDLTS